MSVLLLLLLTEQLVANQPSRPPDTSPLGYAFAGGCGDPNDFGWDV